MGTGYTRNDTSNNIADGNIINAADLDGEFDAIESAFGTSGHTHDGTSAEGGPITVLGPVQDFVASATEIKPKTTNTLDIGTNSLLFKDMFLDGVATLGSIKIDNAGTIGSASDGDAIAISSGGVVTFSQNTIGKTGSGYVLSLQTSDTSIEATNVLGKIEFSAPDEASGTDAILVGASIEALAEDTFDSSTNSTALVFKTNTTGAATERMRLTSAGDLHFLDNRKAVFGAGSDLQIYHDASGDSYITESNASGQLRIQAGNIKIADADGNNFIYMTDLGTGGLVSLYHNGSEKLATTNTGIDVTGNATFDDNGKAIFGAGSDLQIYHDGSNSYIRDDGTGTLRIQGSSSILMQKTDGEIMLIAREDGAVELNHDNAQKLATTSTGVDITGTLTSDGLTVDKGSAGTLATFTDGVNSNFVIETASLITTVGNTGGSTALAFKSADTERMRIDSSGDINLVSSSGSLIDLNFTDSSLNDYARIEGGKSGSGVGDLRFHTYSGGLSEAMRINSSGNVGIGESSPQTPLHIRSDLNSGYNAALQLDNNSTTVGSEIALLFRSRVGSTNTDFSIAGVANAANDMDLTFLSDGNAERMRIDNSGNVGIGITPSAWGDSNRVALQVNSASIDSTGVSQMLLRSNNYYDGTDSIYVNTGAAAAYQQLNGVHTWFNAASGTAGNTITFSENMRIDSSGNVGIGTSSPTAVSGSVALEITGTSGSEVIIGTSDTTATGSDLFGGLAFKSLDSNGTPPHYSGIKARAADTFGGASLEFYAGRSNYESNDPRFIIEGPQSVSGEAMRIDSNGNLLVGTTDDLIWNEAATDNSKEGVVISGRALQISRYQDTQALFNRQGNNGTNLVFANDGVQVGSVTTTGSATSYNTTSDLRLKTDIQPIENGTEKLMAMNPVTHRWKADPEADAVYGFIAQEMQEIVPEAVSGDPDGEEMMSMDYGRITPVLVAALQDAHKKIEALETRLTELEAK